MNCRDVEEDQVTHLLMAWSENDENVLDRLMPLVEKKLRYIAECYFKREDLQHTLQPTALVNEFYLHLAGRRSVSWKNKAHFFGFAAETMRRILVDHARLRRAAKRGEGVRPLPLDEVTEIEAYDRFDLLDLDHALRRLAEIDPRQEQVVALRIFAGLTYDEIAANLGVAPRTVKRDWRMARLWLHKELES